MELKPLQRWSVPAFFVAGIAYPVAEAPFSGSFLFVYLGLLGVAIGLLGLYPALASETPRLARAGVVAIGIAVLVLLVVPVLLVGTAVRAGVEFSNLSEALVASGVVGAALFTLVFPVGTALFGVASLRSDEFARVLGGLLLILPVVWVLALGWVTVGDTTVPEWLGTVLAVVTGAIFLAVSYVLWLERSMADGPSDGWRNEQVRDGFVVNGAESRSLPIPMERRLLLARLEYEALGETARTTTIVERRELYPVVRRLGALLGLERAVEQAIAEQEYLIHEMTEAERHGVGSKRWLLGVGYVATVWLLFVVFGMSITVGVILVIANALTGVLQVTRSAAILGVSSVLAVLSLGFIAWETLKVREQSNE